MLLRIQRNETIRSYIERNIYIYGKAQFKQWNTPQELTAAHIKEVASLLGWHGCYGFNRLLHNHTFQPFHSVFKNSQDMAYSGTRYISEVNNYEPISRAYLTFCPECVRSDVATFGFPYWHRNPLGSLSVCAIHNVVLEAECPICGKPFTSQKHGLNVMWEGCGGKHLSECVAKVNDDPLELKRSRIIDVIYDYPFHISIESALKTLSLRFILKQTEIPKKSSNHKDLYRLSGIINDQLSLVKKHAQNNIGFYFEFVDFDSIINSIAVLYDSFQDFISDIGDSGDQLRGITSLWSTFRSGGHESAHYVEENYSLGVGTWFCPYPSPLSLEFGRGDSARQLIPIDYPCCKIAYAKEPGVQRTKMWADPPHPPIPNIGLENSYGLSSLSALY